MNLTVTFEFHLNIKFKFKNVLGKTVLSTYVWSYSNTQGLKSMKATWKLSWKPLAIAIMPLELCTIYGQKWLTPFLLGVTMPLKIRCLNMGYFFVLPEWPETDKKKDHKQILYAARFS